MDKDINFDNNYIKIPIEFYGILKEYTKSIIINQPLDLLQFSAE